MSDMDVEGSLSREWEPKLELTISPGSNGASLMAWNGANRIAVCGRERAIYVHDFDVSINGRVTLGYDVSEIRFTKKDLLIVAALTGEVSILKLKKDFRCDVNPVQFQRHLLAHNAPIFALDVDPYGGTFISAGADKVVKMWAVSGQKLLGQFRKHTNAVRHLTYTMDGVGFASGGDDREIIEWDSRSPNPIGSISSHCGGGASALSYLAEGHLVVGHRDNNLRVFDARTKKALATYHVYDNPVRSLSLHRSGQFVATACPEDQCVSIIDLLNGAPLTTFTIKMPVKQALFLSPCDPPVNDFDTSDLLCVPGRGRKLNIFNCDLTRLLDDEERTRSSPQNSECLTDDVENSSGALNTSEVSPARTAGPAGRTRPLMGDAIVEEEEAGMNCKDRGEELALGKEEGHAANGAATSHRVEAESGVELMARRVGRMTLARRTIKPKRISLDDLHTLQEKEALQTNLERLPTATGSREPDAGNGAVSMGRVTSQIADLIQRMDRLESVVSSKLGVFDRRLLELEEHCLKNN